MQNLKLIGLYGNEFTTLPSGIFSQLIKAELISLSWNYFKEIPNDLFENLPCLKTVGLHCDEVKECDGFTFVTIGSNSIKMPGCIKSERVDGDFHSLKGCMDKPGRELTPKP